MFLTLSLAEANKGFTVIPSRLYTNDPATRMQGHLVASSADSQFSNITIDLTNHQNLQYTGSAFFGTPLQGSNSSVFAYSTF